MDEFGNYVLELGDSGVIATDWQKEISRPAFINRYKFQINGGTEKHNYNGAFTYQKRQGIIKTTELQEQLQFLICPKHSMKNLSLAF